jgi:glycine cleavage system H protein
MSYPADRKYTRDHEWIRVAGDTGEVGITDYAQKQLGDVVFVELPDVGRKITAGESFGSIESVKAVSELFAPMTGEVVAVNDALRNKPEAVNGAPHDTWIIKVRLASPTDSSALLDAAQYEAHLG